jgi:hypothetical protein
MSVSQRQVIVAAAIIVEGEFDPSQTLLVVFRTGPDLF